MEERGNPQISATVLAAIGFAFCWPLLRRTYPGLLLAGMDNNSLGELGFFAAEVALVGIAALVMKVRGECLPVGGVRGALPVLTAVLFGLSGLGLVLGELGVAAQIVGLGAFACAVPLLFALWLGTLVRAGVRVALPVLSVSFALSFVVSLLSLLEPPLRDGALWVAPLLSVGLWWWVNRLGLNGPAACEGLAPAGRMTFPRELIGVLGLFIVVGGLLRGLSSPAGAAFAPADDMAGILFRNLVSLAIAAILAFGAYVAAYSVRESVIATIGSCALFMVGLCLVATGCDSWVQQGLDLVAMARNCLEFLLAVALVANASQPDTHRGVALTVHFLLPIYGAQLISYGVVPALIQGLGLERSYSDLFVLCSALCLALGMLGAMGFIFLRATRDDGEAVAAPSTALVTARGTEEGLRALQAPLGLTDREVEIGQLLAQGHSYKKVAEVLTISLSTVQSHTRNLYRKCGVNARQGLIDMLADL